MADLEQTQPAGGEADTPFELGRFRLEEALGQGAMGVVFAARDRQLGRRVAIKLLRGRATMALREAQAAAAISHPNVATVYEVGEAGGIAFIAMELLTGETLRERLLRGRLPVDEALGITRQIAEGLAAAHRAGVIHRDLKPANLMLVDGRVKILDFGVAKLADWPDESSATPADVRQVSATFSRQVHGTPAYMAPEQATGGAIDGRADLYALGVTLFEMLTGRRPFPGSSVEQLVRAVSDEPMPRPSSLAPGVPAAVDALIARLCAREPDQRFASAAELIDELDRRPRRPRWLLVPLGLTILTVATLAIWPRRSEPGTRSLRLTHHDRDVRIDKAQISPDGTSVAYLLEGRPRVLTIDGGSVHDLPLGPDSAGSELAWIDDDLLVDGLEDETSMTCRLDLGGSELGVLNQGPPGAVLSPDGKQLAFRGDDYRLFVRAVGPDATARSVAPGLQIRGPLVWSPDSRHLLVIAQATSLATRDLQLSVVDVASGERRVLVSSDRLTDISLRTAWLWRTGEIRYVLYDMLDWDGSEIWSQPVDAAGIARGAPARLWQGNGSATSLSVDTSGRRMAFVNVRETSNVFLGDLTSGPPFALTDMRSITPDDAFDLNLGWTEESPPRQLFFSQRGGETNVFAQVGDDRVFRPLPVGRVGFPVRRVGDRLIYFDVASAEAHGRGSLRWLPVAGGASEPVPGTEQLPMGPELGWYWEVQCARRRPERCVFTWSSHTDPLIYRFDPLGGFSGEVVTRLGGGAFAISADGETLAVHDVEKHVIEVIDFSTGELRREIEIDGPGFHSSHLQALASGEGWIGVGVESDGWIRHIGADGHSSVLWTRPRQWVMRPNLSPDGKQLTVAVRSSDSDVWLLEAPR